MDDTSHPTTQTSRSFTASRHLCTLSARILSSIIGYSTVDHGIQREVIRELTMERIRGSGLGNKPDVKDREITNTTTTIGAITNTRVGEAPSKLQAKVGMPRLEISLLSPSVLLALFFRSSTPSIRANHYGNSPPRFHVIL